MIKLKDALNSKLEMIRNKTLVVPHGHHLANFSGKRGRPAAATKHSSYSAAPTTLMSTTKSLLGVPTNAQSKNLEEEEEEEVDEDDEEEQVAPTQK
jgi:hypothetical protein